jgi:hypothetical protein
MSRWQLRDTGDLEIYEADGSGYVCGCGPPETITDRDRANMRLVARAPELLDYCREMVAVVEGQPRRDPFIVTEEMKALIAEIDGCGHE